MRTEPSATSTKSRPTGAPVPPGRSGDPGLFGPQSISWRVVADPLVGVAGLRALLQQALHPVVTAGFEAHSRYQEEPWARLTRTAEFLALATFSDSASVQAAAAGVRRGHSRGWTDEATGAHHRLDDPELLMWVHCCLVDSLIDVTTRSGLRLDPAAQDAFVAEQVRFGALVGLDPATLPTNRAQLTDYFTATLPILTLSPAACDAVATLLAPSLPVRPALAAPAYAGWSAATVLGFGSLPRWARDLFPIPTGVDALTDATVTSGLRALRLAATGIRAAVPRARRSPYEQEARTRLGLDS